MAIYSRNKNSTKTLLSYLSLIFFLFGFNAIAYAQIEQSQVTLQLKWEHQFQFAGYYAALEKGFYKDAGLEVKILAGGINKPIPVEEVITHRAEFGIGSSSLVLDYLHGEHIVALAAIFQKSPLAWIVRADSDIYSPSDFIGKKARLVEESVELKAMFLYEGIDLEQINFQPYDDAMNDFKNGEKSAFEIYITNDPYVMDLANIPFRLIQPIKYGIDFYSDILFTDDDFLQNNPNTVKAFLAASLKGWEYAFAHQEEIIQLIHNRYQSRKSVEHLRFEASEMRKLILPDFIQLGHMNPRRWQFIAETYVKLGLADNNIDLEEFIYTPNIAFNYRKYLYILFALLFLVITGWLAAAWHIKINKRLSIEIKERYQVEKERNELIHSLQTALNEIKTLEGIIPICSYCHNIRNDEGAWDRIEAYISKHSNAKFSHGVCPDCLKKARIEAGL